MLSQNSNEQSTFDTINNINLQQNIEAKRN